MYQKIYNAYCRLNKGDQAELKRCNLKKLADSPAYFRVLKMTGLQDNAQTCRILFLFIGMDIDTDDDSYSVAIALINAGVKEDHIIQISRSGENGIEYLKRQLIRCKNIDLNSIGKLAQYWGDHARRNLLKEFIISQQD
jgi:CRISPR system Cascade subunit CasB